jgi:hypothetical protein
MCRLAAPLALALPVLVAAACGSSPGGGASTGATTTAVAAGGHGGASTTTSGGAGGASTTTSGGAGGASTTSTGSAGAAQGGGAPGDAGAKHATCGNGRLDAHEACDGALVDESVGTCDANWLGTGTTKCTPDCRLDVSGCEDTDYCHGNGFYSDADGNCDACELVGGHADPDCAAHCGADGVCASWFDSAVQGYSCELTGHGHDPDCGVCGNGVVEGGEFCDGDAYGVYPKGADGGVPLDTCEVWGYAGGALRCNADCTPDFSACTKG